MFDFCQNPEETNLKLVKLVAACSYNDTAFDTSNRSADRTEAKREVSVESSAETERVGIRLLGAGIVDQHMKRIDFFLEKGTRGLPSFIRR